MRDIKYNAELKAKADITYCVCDEKECINMNECERHQNRYNFDKTRNYSFCKFNSNECLKIAN